MITGMHGNLEKVLRDNPGKKYCAGCLAAAAGLTSPEHVVRVESLMNTEYRRYTDRTVGDGICDTCRQDGRVVWFH